MGGQALVKAAGGLLVEAHDGAVPADPGAAVSGMGRRPCAPGGDVVEWRRRPPVLLLILYQRLSGLSTKIGRFFAEFARRKTGGAPAGGKPPGKHPAETGHAFRISPP